MEGSTDSGPAAGERIGDHAIAVIKFSRSLQAECGNFTWKSRLTAEEEDLSVLDQLQRECLHSLEEAHWAKCLMDVRSRDHHERYKDWRHLYVYDDDKELRQSTLARNSLDLLARRVRCEARSGSAMRQLMQVNIYLKEAQARLDDAGIAQIEMAFSILIFMLEFDMKAPQMTVSKKNRTKL